MTPKVAENENPEAELYDTQQAVLMLQRTTAIKRLTDSTSKYKMMVKDEF